MALIVFPSVERKRKLMKIENLKIIYTCTYMIKTSMLY